MEDKEALDQAMLDSWKQDVAEKEEKRQRVQEVIDKLQSQHVLDKLSCSEEIKVRKRIKKTLNKIRERKAAKAEKLRLKEEGLAKFTRGLSIIFAFNILLAILGAFLIYYALTVS